MLSKGFLEIRLVIMRDADGNLLTAEEIDKSGIFHSKIGIFTDLEDNIISFSGSVNETFSGWVSNVEDFDVFCSWKDGGLAHITRHQEKFNKYWPANVQVIGKDILKFHSIYWLGILTEYSF